MSTGYIYIMSNPALRDTCLKIGCTGISPEARRKELSKSTAIPTRFVVEHSVQVKDFKIAEKRVHLLLSNYRLVKQESRGQVR